jgi:hypothetical protein
MPYTTLVPGTTITASWANANVRDQVVTPFATAATRASAVTSPVTGMTTHRADLGSLGGLECYTTTGSWAPAGAQLISSSVLGSAVATVTFSSIPQVFGSLLLVGLGQSSAAAFNTDGTIRINADSGTNYAMTTWDASQAAQNPVGAFTNANTSLIWGLAVPGTSFNVGRAGGFSVLWPGYSTTTLNKVSLHDMWGGDGGTSYIVHKRWGFWAGSAGITSLLLTCGLGANFTVGSYFALYGMP